MKTVDSKADAVGMHAEALELITGRRLLFMVFQGNGAEVRLIRPDGNQDEMLWLLRSLDLVAIDDKGVAKYPLA